MAVITLNKKEADAIRRRAEERLGCNPEDRGGSAEVLLGILASSEYPIFVTLQDEALDDLLRDGDEIRQGVEDNTRLAEGVAIDWKRSGGDAYYVWVVDQIRLRSAVAHPEVKLAEAELKALMHFAKTWILDLAYASDSNWARPGEISVLESRRRLYLRQQNREAIAEDDQDLKRCARIEEDDLEGALDVFGVLQGARLAFSEAKGLPEPGEYVLIEFSGTALRWLRGKRDESRRSLAERCGSVEIDGGTRNDTFVLFVLDNIADQLAGESRETAGELAEAA